jgi:hypothetical protein
MLNMTLKLRLLSRVRPIYFPGVQCALQFDRALSKNNGRSVIYPYLQVAEKYFFQ